MDHPNKRCSQVGLRPRRKTIVWSRIQGWPGVGAWDLRPHGYGPYLPSAFQGVGAAGVVGPIGSPPHNLELNVMNKNYLYFLAVEMIARIENLEAAADHEGLERAGTHEHGLLPDFHFR